MRTSAATVARVLAGLFGMALLAVAGATLCWYWRVAWVRDRLDRIDQDWFERAPHQAWWPWALAAVAGITACIGVMTLLVLLRPSRIPDIVESGSEPTGRVTLSATAIAQSAASELAADRRVRSASGRALLDGRREVLRLTVSIDAQAVPSDLDGLLDRVTARVQSALGPHRIAVEYLLHVGG